MMLSKGFIPLQKKQIFHFRFTGIHIHFKDCSSMVIVFNSLSGRNYFHFQDLKA